jgi:hypothetical protein
VGGGEYVGPAAYPASGRASMEGGAS